MPASPISNLYQRKENILFSFPSYSNITLQEIPFFVVFIIIKLIGVKLVSRFQVYIEITFKIGNALDYFWPILFNNQIFTAKSRLTSLSDN